MEQVSQNCLRNVFYDIYVQENKEEYNQIFKQCGWKFGKENLNQEIKNQFNLKMKNWNK